VLLAFVLSSVLDAGNILLPLVISLILIGMLIIAVKGHLLLQLLGFLLMENGLVLLPTALSIEVPIIGEAVALFDVLVLIFVAILLALKIKNKIGTLDTRELDELIERR
jgi:hydrogenase-4 component E